MEPPWTTLVSTDFIEVFDIVVGDAFAVDCEVYAEDRVTVPL
jgi:hypothetical protein